VSSVFLELNFFSRFKQNFPVTQTFLFLDVEKRSHYSVGSFSGLSGPPPPALVKKEAAQSAFRLLDSYKPNTENLEGHLNIYKDFQEIMNLL
jgi:hypothetical protein